MTPNVGTFDRVLRVVVGLALIAAAFGLYGPAYQTIWGWVGLVPLVTGFVGWCPAYTLIGVDTCKATQRH
jgi:hypothetical protein